MNNQSFFYDAALRNMRLRRSFFPLYIRTKLPYSRLLPGYDLRHAQWRCFQERFPTSDEVEAWRAGSKNQANIALVTGRLSGILAMDIDFDKGGEATWAELTGGRTIHTETSKSGNGIHVKFKHPGGQISRLREQLKGIHLRCDGAYIVDVPSLHRNLKRYEAWIDAPLRDVPGWLQELLIIEDPTAPAVIKTIRQAEMVTQTQVDAILKRYAKKYHSSFYTPNVVDGQSNHEKPKAKHHSQYDSLSEFDQAIIQALYNTGLAEDQFPEILEAATFPTKFCRLLERHGRHSAYIYLDKCLENAAKLTDSSAAQSVSKKAAVIRHWLKVHPFQGRTALSDQFVMEAHIDCYEKAKQEPWFISVRDLEERSDYSHATCAKSNKRLIKAGLICCHKNGKGDFASLWKWGFRWRSEADVGEVLDFDDVTPSQGANFVRGCQDNEERGIEIHSHSARTRLTKDLEVVQEQAPELFLDPLGRPEPDVAVVPTYGVFGRKGVFTKAAESVWRCLWEQQDPCGLTRAEITRLTRRSPSTVSECVKKMSEYSIVFGTGRYYRVNRDFDFKKLATDFDTLHNAERVKRDHEQERQEYREKRAKRRRVAGKNADSDDDTNAGAEHEFGAGE